MRLTASFLLLLLLLLLLCTEVDAVNYWFKGVKAYQSSRGTEVGDEEYTMEGSISVSGGTTGDLGCIKCGANGACTSTGTYGASGTQTKSGGLSMSISIDAWEDDNGDRCEYKTGTFINDDEDRVRKTCTIDMKAYDVDTEVTYRCDGGDAWLEVVFKWWPEPTDAPPTDPPATDPPATDPPATDPPATDPPATDPPATDPPATDPPATDPPATDPPATDPPATDPPATDPPATDPPATDPPATDPPATDPPATDPPATDPPVTDPPATAIPVTASPLAPVTAVPVTLVPETSAPVTTPPATDPPATGIPVTASPAVPVTLVPTVPVTMPPMTSTPLAPLTAVPTPPRTVAPPAVTLVPDTAVPETTAPGPRVRTLSPPRVAPPALTFTPITPTSPSPQGTSTTSPATATPTILSTPVPATLAPKTTAAPPTDPPATKAPPTHSPISNAPDTPSPPSMELECPRTVSDVDVRERRFVVHGYLNTGDSADPVVQVESLTDGVVDGVEYQSTRRGFVQVVRNSSIPGGFYLYLGHPMYLGGDSETVRLTVTDKSTGLVSSCDVDVEASLEESAVEKEPALARGAGAVVASMGSAGAASTIALLSTATCGSQEKLPFLLHPTGLVLNNNRYFGVIVGNLSIAVGATILSYILVYVVFKFLPQCLPFKNLLAAKGLTRFPSVALFIFLFLYQGTSFASLRLVCYHDTFGELCAGIVSTVFCVVVPVATGRAIKTQVPEMGLYKLDKPRPVHTFMLGPGEWVATTKADLWHQRYLSMIKPYLEKTCWFVVFTFLTSFAVGALNVPKVDTMVQCGHLKLGISILFAATSLLVLGLRPYARGRDNLVFFIINVLTTAALALQAFGFYSENMNNWRFTTASQLFQGCMLLVMIKAATDLLCELYILWKGRRKELQEQQWSDGKYGAIPFSGQPCELELMEDPLASENDSTEMLSAGGQGLSTSLLSASVTSTSEQNRRKSFFSPSRTSATGSLYDDSDKGASIGAGSGRKLHAPFPPAVKSPSISPESRSPKHRDSIIHNGDGSIMI